MLQVPEGLSAAFGRDAVDDPRVPLYSHFDGSIVLRGWQAKELMMKGMIYPLRWDSCVRGLVQNGIDTFVEVGPGSWLCELVREIEPEASVFGTDGPAAIERLKASFSSWNF
jgi:[acyl-carrier-protein] S-malonyltransferase